MTNAELAILSLIAEQPRHGYEIEQVIEERGMREWTEIGFSSIYYLLKKLEQDGLIEGQLAEAERGPARKVFRITRAGKKSQRAALLEILSVPRQGYPPLMLGIANLPVIPPAKAMAALQEYRAQLAGRLDNVQTRWDGQRPLPTLVDALFDYSITMIQAEQQWIDRFIKQMEKSQSVETDPGKPPPPQESPRCQKTQPT